MNWNSPFFRRHPALSLHCSPQQGRAARQQAPGLSPQLCAGWHILTDLFTSLSLSLRHLLSEEWELKSASPISIGTMQPSTQWGPQKCLRKKANNLTGRLKTMRHQAECLSKIKDLSSNEARTKIHDPTFSFISSPICKELTNSLLSDPQSEENGNRTMCFLSHQWLCYLWTLLSSVFIGAGEH